MLTGRGKPRKLLLQANRNGFFYLLDRTDGKLLFAKPLVEEADLGQGDRVRWTPGDEPQPDAQSGGQPDLSAVEGAANFFSTSYNPATGLFYVNTLERCNVYTRSPTAEWRAGRGYSGGGGAPRSGGQGAENSRAPSTFKTGKVVWEHPEEGEGETWSGTLSTASGLVFLRR